jgi:hypothetical protein
MHFLHQPLLGTLPAHPDAGAVVAGISLAPVSPAVTARFAAIGGSGVIIDMTEAAARLLGIATAPSKTLALHLARLQALAVRGRGYVTEALGLFPIASGDEADQISGMIAAIARPHVRLPEGLTDDADFLRAHRAAIVGIDTTPIASALDVIDATKAAIATVEDEIGCVVLELRALAEKVRAPESIAEARKRRVSAKAARVIPGLIAELHRMRAATAEALATLDRMLLAAEGVQ